jgi:hypothetical protein
MIFTRVLVFVRTINYSLLLFFFLFYLLLPMVFLEGICGLFKKLMSCKELSLEWLDLWLMIVKMDVWVKGPAKMSADLIHLINIDSSKTVYSSLIRTIKNRRYRYVSRVKKTRTSISRDKDFWRSPWDPSLDKSVCASSAYTILSSRS